MNSLPACHHKGRVCLCGCVCLCVLRDECSAELSELGILPAATLSHYRVMLQVALENSIR